MSMCTQVYIGPYLVCKMIQQTIEEESRVCSKNQKHTQDQWDEQQHCSKCGGKIIVAVLPEEVPLSLGYLEYEKDEDEWTKDEKKLMKLFEPIESSNVGFNKDGYEILLCPTTRGFSGDEEKIHKVKPEKFRAMVDEIKPAHLKLLQKVMKYESIEAKCGVLISIA